VNCFLASEVFETLEMKVFIVQAFDAAYHAARDGC
jgi:hypothetical protein